MRKSILATLVLIALTHGLAAKADSYQQSMAGSEAVPIYNEYYDNGSGNYQTSNSTTSNNVPMYRQANGNLTDVDAALHNNQVVPGGTGYPHEIKMEVRTYQ